MQFRKCDINMHTILTVFQGANGYRLDQVMADIPAVVQALGHARCILVAHDCEYSGRPLITLWILISHIVQVSV